MNIFRSKRNSRRRKNSFKLDNEGLSARKRAFKAFSDGKTFEEVCIISGISRRTAYRYKASWKEIHPHLDIDYKLLNKARKATDGFSNATLLKMAKMFGITIDEVKIELGKPWGLKRMLMGRWPNGPDQQKAREIEARFNLALDLETILESTGLSLDDLTQIASKLKKEKATKDDLEKK